jgi:primosomal protein N' (replication factor Y)
MAAELDERRSLSYPPFVNLLKLSYSAPTREAAQTAAGRLAATLSKRSGVTVVGPAPAFLETLGNKYHWQLAVKSDRRSSLVEIARSVPESWVADLDPSNLL